MIHSTAVISKKSKNVGDNTKIGPFCVVGNSVEIGSVVNLLVML